MTFRLQYIACYMYNIAMTALTFDTHFFVKKLTKEGISEKQAEAIVEFVREIRETDLNTAVTKGDLRELELKLQAEITNVKVEIFNVKADIIKWMLGSLFLQAGFIVTLVKLLN